MKLRYFFAPDAAETAASAHINAPTATDTHTRHMAAIPTKDTNLGSVAQLVNTQWALSPFITLVYKTQADFTMDVTNYQAELEQRKAAGSSRPQQTNDLEHIDAQMEDAIPYIKSYINEKHGPKDGPAHYAQYGLVHHSSRSYQLPTNRQERTQSLKLIVAAVTADGFDAKTYGHNFWAGIQTSYAAALTAASDAKSHISQHVSELTQLRTTIRRVLHSLLLVLEGNYPDTFDQVRRTWGFQKENY